MGGNNGKIRHVNGAGDIRWFTPAVAANKAAMNSGGWFPQPEASEKDFQSDKGLKQGISSEELARVTSLVQENKELKVALDAERAESDNKNTVISDLNSLVATKEDIITELRSEIEQLKSDHATTKKATKKQDEPK